MQAASTRFSFYDGRMGDLGGPLGAELVPLISDNWTKHFTWLGVGAMPEAERAKLRTIVATAHARGQEVRFWSTPDAALPNREAVWRELVAADVDVLNTDDLAGLQGDSPVEPIISALMGRSASRLHGLCAAMLRRRYPRLTRPPFRLQSEELLGAVVERLLKALLG